MGPICPISPLTGTALVFITVPVGSALALNEIAPDVLERLGLNDAETLLIMFAAYGMLVGFLMMVSWRSRDLVDLLDFELARRRLDDARIIDE